MASSQDASPRSIQDAPGSRTYARALNEDYGVGYRQAQREREALAVQLREKQLAAIQLAQRVKVTLWTKVHTPT